MENNIKQNLEDAVKKYMDRFMNTYNVEDQERMIAGIYAFMWTEWHKEPYLPVNTFSYSDDPNIIIKIINFIKAKIYGK
jgi:hypothetical protein